MSRETLAGLLSVDRDSGAKRQRNPQLLRTVWRQAAPGAAGRAGGPGGPSEGLTETTKLLAGGLVSSLFHGMEEGTAGGILPAGNAIGILLEAAARKQR